jgi:lipoyl(octanoyl) transferase
LIEVVMRVLSTGSSHDPRISNSLEAHLLGLVDFDAALALQERLIFDLSGRADRQGALLICEHPPLLTLGRDASSRQIAATDEELDTREIATRWISRGGPAIIHARGQLAIYPLLPLNRLGVGVAEFCEKIESAIVDVCHEQRIAAKRRNSEPGVWTRYGQVATFGAAVKSWISCHGIFLNVTIDPTFFKLLALPPGQRLTTIECQRLRPVAMNQVRESVIRLIAAAFNYETVHTYVGHPLLKRTRRRICLHA